MSALEVIDTFVTNPGTTTLVATAPYTGDTLSIRNFPDPSKAGLLDVWSVGTALNAHRIRSPRLHDNVQGLRMRNVAGAAARGELTDWMRQLVYAQDALIFEMNGGAAETDGMSALVYYETLPGVDARLTTYDAISARIENLFTQEVAGTGGVAVGTRQASVAINTTFDLMQANTDYVLLGYEVDAVGQSIGVRGPDTGNLRVGGPMTTEKIETRDWFQRLSSFHGIALCPIINAANKAGTFVDSSQVVAGVAYNLTLLMAQLQN